MSEETLRQELAKAIKARALFYYAFYKEFSAEIGATATPLSLTAGQRP